ncbi:MAG: hypothetical protein AAF512_14635, partial [Pseudomonadota bacterium]
MIIPTPSFAAARCDVAGDSKICRVGLNESFMLKRRGLAEPSSGVSWRKETGPDWVTVDPANGELSGMSNNEQEAHYVMQKASDGTQVVTLLIVGDPETQKIYFMGPNEPLKSLQQITGDIRAGTLSIMPGDVVIVRDGFYPQSENDISNYMSSGSWRWNLFNGAPGAWTTIIAEHPGRAVFEAIELSLNPEYIALKGLTLNGSLVITGSSNNISTVPHHIKVMQSSFRKSIVMNFGAHDILFEDTISDGGGRGQILIGRRVQNIVLRRCVIRSSYTDAVEPTAIVLMYGAGSASSAFENIEIQNCIILDQSKRRENFEHASARYGAFEILNGSNISIRGTVVLDIDDEFFFDNRDSDNVLVEQSVFWKAPELGFRIRGNESQIRTNNHRIANITTGSVSFTSILPFMFSGRSAARVENSFFHQITWVNAEGGSQTLFGGEFTSTTNNMFSQITNLAPGIVPHPLTENNNLSFNYLLDSKLSLPNGQPIGAKVLQRYGVSGSMWGEPGYDSIATDALPLWPFPQEDRIKREFSELEVKAGDIEAYPQIIVNDADARGLTAFNSQFGSPNSLSAYIWEYLNAKAPDD